MSDSVAKMSHPVWQCCSAQWGEARIQSTSGH